MKRSKLQGTPWHYEQVQRTCKNGSKYCIYNKNICVCKCSPHHHKKCVGKGNCDEFESKGNEAKTLSSQYIKSNNKKREFKMIENTSLDIEEENIIPNETQEDKFKRISYGRIKNVVDDLRKIASLSNKARYSYTDKEIEKMFTYLQRALDKTKDAFKQEDFMEEFKW